MKKVHIVTSSGNHLLIPKTTNTWVIKRQDQKLEKSPHPRVEVGAEKSRGNYCQSSNPIQPAIAPQKPLESEKLHIRTY